MHYLLYASSQDCISICATWQIVEKQRHLTSTNHSSLQRSQSFNLFYFLGYRINFAATALYLTLISIPLWRRHRISSSFQREALSLWEPSDQLLVDQVSILHKYHDNFVYDFDSHASMSAFSKWRKLEKYSITSFFRVRLVPGSSTRTCRRWIGCRSSLISTLYTINNTFANVAALYE